MPTTLRDALRITVKADSGGVRFINLTGHVVTLIVGQQTRTFQPEGMVSRVEYLATHLAPIETTDDKGKRMMLPRRRVRRGRIVNLPQAVEGVIFLVSRIVASYAHRSDLIVPDGVMRDSKGSSFGCTYLTEVDESA